MLAVLIVRRGECGEDWRFGDFSYPILCTHALCSFLFSCFSFCPHLFRSLLTLRRAPLLLFCPFSSRSFFFPLFLALSLSRLLFSVRYRDITKFRFVSRFRFFLRRRSRSLSLSFFLALSIFFFFFWTFAH